MKQTITNEANAQDWWQGYWPYNKTPNMLKAKFPNIIFHSSTVTGSGLRVCIGDWVVIRGQKRRVLGIDLYKYPCGILCARLWYSSAIEFIADIVTGPNACMVEPINFTRQ